MGWFLFAVHRFFLLCSKPKGRYGSRATGGQPPQYLPALPLALHHEQVPLQVRMPMIVLEAGGNDDLAHASLPQ